MDFIFKVIFELLTPKRTDGQTDRHTDDMHRNIIRPKALRAYKNEADIFPMQARLPKDFPFSIKVNVKV